MSVDSVYVYLEKGEPNISKALGLYIVRSLK